ncbi:MAG: DoxX family protein [Proteobacteria bacterium]|nr:DoxX family protein [Pseudomonadota bacterium]
MPNSLQNLASFVGRVLIAVLFVPSGVGKALAFSGTTGYIASRGLPLPSLGAVIAVFCELGLGLLVLFGYKTRISALLLAIFTVAAAIFFHNYWDAGAAQVMMQKINFYKNLAIAGGLLSLVAFGAGAWSLDGSRR